ncbi:hypothetical protein [Shewanella sp. Koi 1]
MITATAHGYYEVSLDGGKSFLPKQHNLLLNGYYNTNTGTTTCQIGTGNAAPTATNSALTGAITSATGTQVSQTYSFEAATGSIVITTKYQYVFATNLTITAQEIGIRQGSTLVSRALFKNTEGGTEALDITPVDYFVVRYTLIQKVPSSAVPVIMVLDGNSYTGILMVCNPNKWSTSIFGTLNISTGYINLLNGVYTRDANGYLSGTPTVINSYLATSASNTSATMKERTFTVSSGLNEIDTAFNIIALSGNANNTALEVQAFIQLDSPVVRTSDFIVNATFHLQQVAA